MRLLFVAAFVVFAFSGASAFADVRVIAIAQPPDSAPTLTGIPEVPDLSTLNIAYDSTAGSIAVTIGFHNPVTIMDLMQNFAWYGDFTVGQGDAPNDPSTFCDGGVDGTFELAGRVDFYNRFSVTGFDGYAGLAPTLSADGHSLSFTISHPALVGQNYTCAHLEIDSYSRSSVSNTNSQYNVTCGCWYVPGPSDAFGSSDRGDSADNVLSTVWFNGFSPQAATKLKLSAVSCGRRHQVDYDWAITPDVIGPAKQPYKTVVMRLDGVSKKVLKVHRRGSIDPNTSTSDRPFFDLLAGRYRLTMSYPGDNFRTTPKSVSKLVTCKL